MDQLVIDFFQRAVERTAEDAMEMQEHIGVLKAALEVSDLDEAMFALQELRRLVSVAEGRLVLAQKVSAQPSGACCE